MRDFKQATTLFLDTVSTFTSYEMMDYKRFVELTVILSIFSLSRNELKEKVLWPHHVAARVFVRVVFFHSRWQLHFI